MSLSGLRERTFWLLLVSLVVVGAAAGLFGNRPHVVSLKLAPGAPQPEPQAARERAWRKVSLERIASLPAGEGKTLQSPTILRIGANGEAYVLDSGGPAIVSISPQGAIVSRWTVPGLGDPTDLAVAEDGRIWIADPDHSRVVTVASGGGSPKIVDVEVPPVRILPSPDGFVATPLKRSPSFFLRYDAGGQLLNSFAELFPEDVQSALTVDGWLVNAGSDAFVFLFRQASLLASYSTAGDLRFLRQTINPGPFPKIQVDSAGRQRIDPEARLASISGSFVDGNLYVLSAERGRSLDVYAMGTGEYLYSFEAPEKDARYVVLSRDRLFSASRRGVTVWQWD